MARNMEEAVQDAFELVGACQADRERLEELVDEARDRIAEMGRMLDEYGEALADAACGLDGPADEADPQAFAEAVGSTASLATFSEHGALSSLASDIAAAVGALSDRRGRMDEVARELSERGDL